MSKITLKKSSIFITAVFFLFGGFFVTTNYALAKSDQTIDFGEISDKTFGIGTFDVSATASSGLEVSFTGSDACPMTGDAGHSVVVSAVGSCTVTAHQSGNDDYNPAPDVVRTFNIIKAEQTITFQALVNKIIGDPDFNVSTTRDSTLDVYFTASGECTVSNDYNIANVHLLDIGNCTITAHQDGNSNYNAAVSVTRTFLILTSTQTSPDVATGNATINSTTPEVVITDPDQAVTVTVDNNTTNPKIDVSAFTPDSDGKRNVPAITINSNIANVIIADNTIITASGWDGILSAPTTLSSSGNPPSGFSVGSTMIELGSSSLTLSFDKAVKITLTGVVGTVGYKPAGSDTWQTITTECNGVVDASNISSGECYFTNGNDTIIWTYHFTSFGGFNKVASRSGSSGSRVVVFVPVVSTPVVEVLKTQEEGQVLGAEKFNFSLALKIGSNGNEVMELQKFLNKNNYVLASTGFGSPGNETIYFRSKTKAALIKFQIANGLKGDGIVDSKTLELLNK